VPVPPTSVLRRQLCRTPSPTLLGHAWAKHGSCMARTAGGYFRISNILADSVGYPDMERLSRDPALTAGALRAALAAANPGRRPESFAVRVNRRGWLQEVWLCLDRRFRSVRCPARQTGAADGAPLRIWRGL
jgi:ribonuclease T2